MTLKLSAERAYGFDIVGGGISCRPIFIPSLDSVRWAVVGEQVYHYQLVDFAVIWEIGSLYLEGRAR